MARSPCFAPRPLRPLHRARQRLAPSLRPIVDSHPTCDSWPFSHSPPQTSSHAAPGFVPPRFVGGPCQDHNLDRTDETLTTVFLNASLFQLNQRLIFLEVSLFHFSQRRIFSKSSRFQFSQPLHERVRP
jgi:hypothetical protein